jgi:endonuclease YncB( thermonuclease family)
MALADLEALTAGVKVRCEVVERDRQGRLVAKVFSANGSTSAAGWCRGLGVSAVVDGLRRPQGQGAEGQAGNVAGHLCETLAVARIGAAAARRGSSGVQVVPFVTEHPP